MAGIVPSSSLGRQATWRKKLDEGGAEPEASPPPPRKPPLPKEGSFSPPIVAFPRASAQQCPHLTRAMLLAERPGSHLRRRLSGRVASILLPASACERRALCLARA
eukprot:669065-Rhodomonas_salina.2